MRTFFLFITLLCQSSQAGDLATLLATELRKMDQGIQTKFPESSELADVLLEKTSAPETFRAILNGLLEVYPDFDARLLNQADFSVVLMQGANARWTVVLWILQTARPEDTAVQKLFLKILSLEVKEQVRRVITQQLMKDGWESARADILAQLRAIADPERVVGVGTQEQATAAASAQVIESLLCALVTKATAP